MPPTTLGNAIQKQKTPPPKQSKFRAAIERNRVFHPFRIERLGVDAIMTLVAHNRRQQFEGEAYAEVNGRLKLPYERWTEPRYESELIVRILSDVVLDAEAHKHGQIVPLGTLEEWQSLDEDIIEECWRVHVDVRAAYDPLSTPLTPDDLAMIEEALKKKRATPLRFLGVRRLSTYLLTMADRLLSFPTGTSDAGDESPGSSDPPTSESLDSKPSTT